MNKNFMEKLKEAGLTVEFVNVNGDKLKELGTVAGSSMSDAIQKLLNSKTETINTKKLIDDSVLRSMAQFYADPNNMDGDVLYEERKSFANTNEKCICENDSTIEDDNTLSFIHVTSIIKPGDTFYSDEFRITMDYDKGMLIESKNNLDMVNVLKENFIKLQIKFDLKDPINSMSSKTKFLYKNNCNCMSNDLIESLSKPLTKKEIMDIIYCEVDNLEYFVDLIDNGEIIKVL